MSPTSCTTIRSRGVSAVRELSTTVLRVADVELRFVKTPHRAARRPDFAHDFRWMSSELRWAAAERNRLAYRPVDATLFDAELTDQHGTVDKCRDVFVLWAAELETGLTAGWLGLPIIGADSWLAVSPLWWDEPPVGATVKAVSEVTEHTGANGDVPVASVKLKARRAASGL
jgi:hypothetical protein